MVTISTQKFYLNYSEIFWKIYFLLNHWIISNCSIVHYKAPSLFKMHFLNFELCLLVTTLLNFSWVTRNQGILRQEISRKKNRQEKREIDIGKKGIYKKRFWDFRPFSRPKDQERPKNKILPMTQNCPIWLEK